jgi:hypothetical protein
VFVFQQKKKKKKKQRKLIRSTSKDRTGVAAQQPIVQRAVARKRTSVFRTVFPF